MKREIGLDEPLLQRLIKSGFAPDFRSLAWMLRSAVELGAEQVYEGLETEGISLPHANSLARVLENVSVPDAALLKMVSDPKDAAPLGEVLQHAARTGAIKMYQGLEPADRDRASVIFGEVFEHHA